LVTSLNRRGWKEDKRHCLSPVHCSPGTIYNNHYKALPYYCIEDMKKIAVMAIAFLLSIPFASINGNNVSLINGANGNTLYVGGSGPNNYTSITEALGDASNGDTIFVYPGTYHERLSIHKSINLISKNRNTTIIDGGGVYDVVTILANSVIISGFTIQNSGSGTYESGIHVQSSYNIITNNVITKNYEGIYLEDSNHNAIANNVITKNYYGMLLRDGSNYNHIFSNGIAYNERAGIRVSGLSGYNFSHNNISSNIVSNNGGGMSFSDFSNNVIYGNVFNADGISLQYSNNNYIYGNTIIPGSHNRTVVISLDFSFSNRVTHNNFMKNSAAFFHFSWVMGHNPYTNNWDGNYWGRPRILPKPIVGWWAPFLWLNFDWHPAMKPYGDFTLEMKPWKK